MGVKGLWTFLSPICDKKSLWELQDQTVAIDLSCWICDSQTISFAVTRPHLRNLFFRTSCLLLSGIQPIFVLEGEAPDIKQKEIRRRIQTVWNRADSNLKKKQTRPRLNIIIKQCCKLLESLGVSSVQSPGEGEAMCAHLNAIGLADGCITQDNDCFLYGANVVYRNFSSSHSSKGGGSTGFSVDVYDMALVQKLLGLDREGLVALALLCGCDYQTDSNDARGVTGIGIETAAHLISYLSKLSESVLARLKSWSNDPNFVKLEKEAAEVESGPNCIHCGHRGNLGRHDRVGCKTCDSEKGCQIKCSFSKENSLLNMPLEKRRFLMMELGIRRKALANPNFPSQSIIDEYLLPHTSSAPPLKHSPVQWVQPNLQRFLEFAESYLGWPEDYSLEKFLPLLTRWKVLQGKMENGSLHPHDVIPIHIKKERVSKGTCYYEVDWKLIPAIAQMSQFSTLEPRSKFEDSYPLLVEEFRMNRNKKPKKGTKKSGRKSPIKTDKAQCKCSSRNIEKKGHICHFLTNKESLKLDGRLEDKISDLQTDVNVVTKLLENLNVQEGDVSSSCSDEECVPEIDDEIDALELSAIVKGIVGVSSASPARDLDKPSISTEYYSKAKPSCSDPDVSSNFSDDEFSELNFPLYLRAKCRMKKQTDSSNCLSSISPDKEMPPKQMESAYSEVDDTVDKSSEDSSLTSISTPQNFNFKGHLPCPTFSLGITPLLQSPDIHKAEKAINDDTPLKSKDKIM